MRNGALGFLVLSLLGCGGSTPTQELVITPDAGGGDTSPMGDDADEEASFGDADAAPDVAIDTAPDPGASRIKHVVVIVQENHTFDAYFGRWCTAETGSSPTCTTGPSCCERAPDKDPAGNAFITLDDTANGAYDPDHSQSCELSELDGGKMDKFTAGASCSDKRNFAVATDAVKQYHDWATANAVADRYFQPLAGSSSANDMYFAVAKYQFTDNEVKPASNGKGCIAPTTPTKTFTGVTTIADLLLGAGHTFGFYAEGYDAMIGSTFCPKPPSDCTGPSLLLSPCNYDCSDVPFEYYDQFVDKKPYMKDWNDFDADVATSKLPTLSFIKFTAYHNEHPGFSTKISNGVTMVKKAVDRIAGSKYADDTLVLLTWDEGGGFFDHVSPPKDSAVDGKPYGTRVPLLAIGRFAKKGAVSHVEMEHSSVVKFLEWNFLAGKTGQLAARDETVNNLGSMLDPIEVGTTVPEK
ncbi:MAG: phospholipase C [Polyangiales bacterium]